MPTLEINLNPVCGTEVEVFFVLALCSNFIKKTLDLCMNPCRHGKLLATFWDTVDKKYDFALCE
jgi:hypothetical protein